MRGDYKPLRGEELRLKTLAVYNLLHDGRWWTSTQIEECTGVTGVQMRQISNATGDFASCDKGYKRADLATLDELRHTENHLKSRIRKITIHIARFQKHLKQAQSDPTRNLGQMTIFD
jgi:hypothetical protein